MNHWIINSFFIISFKEKAILAFQRVVFDKRLFSMKSEKGINQ